MSMVEESAQAMRPEDYRGLNTGAAKDIGPLEAAMNGHRSVISDLHAELEMLASQLSPVMQVAPEGPSDLVRGDVPHAPRSPHVADLNEQTERIQEAIERIRQLRSYLDVR